MSIPIIILFSFSLMLVSPLKEKNDSALLLRSENDSALLLRSENDSALLLRSEFCHMCTWNFFKNGSISLLHISDQFSLKDSDYPNSVSLQRHKCEEGHGICTTFWRQDNVNIQFISQIDTKKVFAKSSKRSTESSLENSLLQLFEILFSVRHSKLNYFTVNQASKLMVTITSRLALMNKVKTLVTSQCSKVKEAVAFLLFCSDILIDYFIINSKMNGTNFKRNLNTNRQLLKVLINTETLLSKCFTPRIREAMLQTKKLLLRIATLKSFNQKSSFDSLTYHNSFVEISPSLMSCLAQQSKNVLVFFALTENFFPAENSILTGQLILLTVRKKNFETIKMLSAPIDLFFRYDSKPQGDYLTKHSIYTPNVNGKNMDSFDEDEVQAVYRMEPVMYHGPVTIFIKFYNISTIKLKVLFLHNLPPNRDDMTKYGQEISFETPIYKINLKEEVKGKINYLWVIPTRDEFVGNTEYSFEVRYLQCQYRYQNEWKSNGCQVGNKTNETILHCQCWHLSFFGGGVAIAPKQIDIKEDIKLLYKLKDHPLVSIVVVCLLLLYLIVLVWTRHNDSKDSLQRFVVVLDDNFPGEEWPYLLTVYTGLWIGSGTDANIGIRLYGSAGVSRIHNLQSSSQRKVLKANCDDWFLIFSPKNLGEIEKIHIFSDYSGKGPDWYFKKLLLYDLEGEKDYKFVIEKWVSLAEEDDCVDFFCYPIITRKSLRRDRIAIDNVMFGLWETHLLLSIFTRHPRSSVTRSQRLSICITMLLVHMLTSIMFHELETPEYPLIYSEIKRKLVIQMESTLLANPFTFIVIFCFKKSRIVTAPINDVPITLTSTQAVPLETGLEMNQGNRAFSKSNENIIEDKKSNPQSSSLFKYFEENLETADENEETGREEELDEEEEDDEEAEDEGEEEEEEEIVEEEEEEENEIEEGCWVSIYKQVKALLFQVIPCKTIMPVKIAEEDTESAKVRGKWTCFAWLLSETAIFGSAFFIMLYTVKMEPHSSRVWLINNIKYLVANIFLLSPTKIFIFATVLAVLYGQLNYIPSYECNTEAAMKKRLVGNKKFLSRLLLIRKNKWYKPLSSKRTAAFRLREKSWRRWRITINFVVVVLIYLILFVEILITWNGPYITERDHIHRIFTPELNPQPITNYRLYKDYLTKVVFPAYDKRNWYNGFPRIVTGTWKHGMGYLNDYSLRLMGVPQLRQQRVKPDSCTVNKLMANKVMLQCNAPMTRSTIDKRDYATGWTQPEKITVDPESEWSFSKATNEPLVMCSYNTTKCYKNGGYVAKLSYNRHDSETILQGLIKNEWFDSLTRLICMEMIVYDVHCNFISFVVSMLEKLADGSFHVHVQSVTLHPQSGDWAPLLVMLFFSSYYILRIILLFNRNGLKYLLSWTGVLDVFLNILLYMTMICIYLYQEARYQYLVQWQFEEEKDLQITKNVFMYRDLVRYETAILVVVMPMQFLHNFRFGKRFFTYFRILTYIFKVSIGLATVVLFSFIALHIVSIINNFSSMYCFFCRSFNTVSYCSAIPYKGSGFGQFTLFFWFSTDVAAFMTCVVVIYSYKWMKVRCKHADDFNMAVFVVNKLKLNLKLLKRHLCRMRKRVVSFTKTRMRAGVDEFDTEEAEEIPQNKPLAYTQQMCEDLNIKVDSILEKLKKWERSLN